MIFLNNMETIIKSIEEKLRAQVPELKWIDQDFGQLELENPPVNFPCALIDVQEVDWENTTQLDQQGDTLVNIRIAFRVYDRSNIHTPTPLRQRAVAHFSVLKKIKKHLHGAEDAEANYNSLKCIKTRRNKTIDPRVYTMSFNTTLFDNRERQETPKPPLRIARKRL